MNQLYYNGKILTMEDDEIAEAVLVKDGIIVEVGKYKDIANKSHDAEKIDLNGHTMIPAFIDPHSHFSGVANSLLQVPLGETVSVEEIVERIDKYIKTHNLKENEWVLGEGYDNNNFEGKIHPTCEDLDRASKDFPIMIQHESGHVGVFNSKALELLGITIDTPSPKGGLIEKKDNKLTGYMEENAFTHYIREVPFPNEEDLFKAYIKAQEKYLSYGITTVQEGFMVEQLIPLYKLLIKDNLLKIDLVGYSEVSSADKLQANFQNSIMKYNKHFKLGGYKIFLDCSPQARTAWMTTPYLGGDGYYGYGTMDYKDVCNAIREATKRNLQILAHCNGDAAAKQYISAIKEVKSEGYDVSILRPVMIHAQLLRVDQLPEVKEEGIIPSFFIAHIYHWGDVHIKNYGFDRASKISPAGSALKNNICFTFHQDSPVIDPDMIETIHCAVNRITKMGVLLGEDEKISISEALKAVTINAAFQYFEENKKGSIKEGKNADFVILDKNPLEVLSNEIRDIKVLETIKDGNSVFKANFN